jgi:hypothetical protein
MANPSDSAPLGDEALTDKDTSYSPASETETERKQEEPRDSRALEQDVDASQVDVLPGTGGPDDVGDVDVSDDDLNLPRDTGAH